MRQPETNPQTTEGASYGPATGGNDCVRSSSRNNEQDRDGGRESILRAGSGIPGATPDEGRDAGSVQPSGSSARSGSLQDRSGLNQCCSLSERSKGWYCRLDAGHDGPHVGGYNMDETWVDSPTEYQRGRADGIAYAFAALSDPLPEFPHSTCVECGRRIPGGSVQKCSLTAGGFCNWHIPAALREHMKRPDPLHKFNQIPAADMAELGVDRG